MAKLRVDFSHVPSRARYDGWVNALSGFGVEGKDKSLVTTYTPDTLTIEQCRDMWLSSDLAARIIEKVPRECFRRGFGVKVADDKPLTDKVMKAYKRLKVRKKLREAHEYARAYGGGALLIGFEDYAPMSAPVNFKNVRGVKWLTVLEPRELMPVEWYVDPREDKFGQVKYYELWPTVVSGQPSTLSAMRVHESRLAVLPGIEVSRSQVTSLLGWGDSVLTRVWRVLSKFDMSWDATAALLHEFSIAVFGMKGLAELIALDKNEVVQNRIKAVNLSKSVINAILIDAEGETFERKQTPVTGLKELLEAFWNRLSAAAEMPVTVLAGMSPSGMNATGQSDFQGWYDTIEGIQEDDLMDPLEYITKAIICGETRGKEPENWSCFFQPLNRPTVKEAAEARYIQAQTDQIYITQQVVTPEEIGTSRFGGEEYSFETIIDFDAPREFMEKPEPNNPFLKEVEKEEEPEEDDEE